MADNEDVKIKVTADATSTKKAAAEAKKAMAALEAAGVDVAAAFKSIKSAVDPAWAAQQKYNDAVNTAKALHKAGALSMLDYAKYVAAAKAEYAKFTPAAIAAANAAKKAADDQKAALAAEAAQRAQQRREIAAGNLAERQAAAERARIRREDKAARDAAKAAAAAEAAANKAAAEAAKQLSTALRGISSAASSVGTSMETVARVIGKDVTAAQKKAAAESKAFEAQQKAAGASIQKLARSLGASHTEAAKAAIAAERAEAALNKEVMAARAAADPTIAATQRYNKTLADMSRLLGLAKISQAEFDSRMKVAAVLRDQNTRGLGVQNQMYIQMGYQLQDVTASLASGISPFVIIAQQGGQMAAAMSTAGGTVGKFASFMAGPWGAAMLAAVTALGFLAPKLFETKEAVDYLAEAEKAFENVLDNSTGAINRQASALDRLMAKRAAERADEQAGTKLREAADSARSVVKQAITPLETYTPEGIKLPGSDLTDASTKNVGILNSMLKRTDVTATELAATVLSMYNAGDKGLKKYVDRMVELGGGAQRVTQELTRIHARQAVVNGTATEAQKILAGQGAAMAERAANAAAYATAQTEVERVTILAGIKTRAINEGIAKGTIDRVEGTRQLIQITREVQAAEKAAGDAKKAASEQTKADNAAERAAKAEAKRLAREAEAEAKRAADEALRSNMIAGDALLARAQRSASVEQRIADTRLGIEQQANDSYNQLGLISDSQLLAREAALNATRYQMAVALENQLFNLESQEILRQMQLAGISESEYARLYARLQAARQEHLDALRQMEVDHQAGISQINQRAAEDSKRNWEKITGPISSAFGQVFQAVYMRQNSLSGALVSSFHSVMSSLGSMGMEAAMKWIATQTWAAITGTGIAATAEAAKTAIVVAGSTTQAGAVVAGQAVATGAVATGAIAQIGAYAATAAAGAWAAISSIPVVGPFLAPAIAAAALVGVLALGNKIFSAEGGSVNVPHDGAMYRLHQEEMVLPAWAANPLRAQLKGSGPQRGSFSYMGGAANDGAGMNDAGSAGVTGLRDLHVHLPSMDPVSGGRWIMNNRRAFAKAVAVAVREGAVK